MNLRSVVARHGRALALLAAAVALLAALAVDPHGPLPGVVGLGGLVVVGEMIGFRLGANLFVPLAPAVVLVLVRILGAPGARAGDDLRFVVVVAVAEVVAGLARPADRAPGGRWRPSVVHTSAALTAFAAAGATTNLLGGSDERSTALLSLAAAAGALVAIDLAARGALARDDLLRSGGVRVYSALAASGMLMALGAHGVPGDRSLGLWGVAMFAVPLLAAWYSFGRVDAVRRTTDQTIRALSIVPERAGLAAPGHAARVAQLAGDIARAMALPDSTRRTIEHAALLHHLGAVCLEEPEAQSLTAPADVTEASARMLSKTVHLEPAARVLDAAALHHRGRDATLAPTTRLAAQVLKVASDFDDVTGGDHDRGAVESLYSAPGYVYDPRVLAALERVVV